MTKNDVTIKNYKCGLHGEVKPNVTPSCPKRKEVMQPLEQDSSFTCKKCGALWKSDGQTLINVTPSFEDGLKIGFEDGLRRAREVVWELRKYYNEDRIPNRTSYNLALSDGLEAIDKLNEQM